MLVRGRDGSYPTWTIKEIGASIQDVASAQLVRAEEGSAGGERRGLDAESLRTIKDYLANLRTGSGVQTVFESSVVAEHLRD